MPDAAALIGEEQKTAPTPPHKDDLPPVAVTFAKGVLVGLLLGGIAGGLFIAGTHNPQALK